MFAIIAKLRAARVARAASGPAATLAHANDNAKIVHGAAGVHRRGRPPLLCRWRPTTGGGLECCWDAETAEQAGTDEPDRRPAAGCGLFGFRLAA
jgi:hypothetical protein